MRHKTIAQYEEAVRQQCRRCQQTSRLCMEHCAENKCLWFDDREALILRTRQLSLFTYDGFLIEIENLIKLCAQDFLHEMYFSDIRERLEKMLNGKRSKIPEGKALNWWGKIGQFVLIKNGWIRNESRYRWTAKGGKDYLYIKAGQ